MTSTAELSFGQERIWLLEQLLPGKLTHHLTLAYEIRGPLDPAVLSRAAQAVVERHAPLRTTFHERDGQPYFTVHDTAPPVLRVVPLASFDEWAGRAEAEIGAEFDLSRLPLLRMTLFPIADDHHVLLVVVHHIVSDGASLVVLVDELSDAYAALLERGRWLPADLPTTYQRHVEQERTAFADGAWASAEPTAAQQSNTPATNLTDKPTMRPLRASRRCMRVPPTILNFPGNDSCTS